MQKIIIPKAFVTGWPIAHSRSPALHGFWLKQLAIIGSYEAVATPPDAINGFLDGFTDEGFIGGNVTIPYKEAAFKRAEKPDATAKILGAVNTLWLEEGIICATNTDAYGFMANLDEHAPKWRNGSKAVILGAGGASRSAIHAVIQAGYSSIFIINRTRTRAQALAHRFGEKCSAHGWDMLDELLCEADLLVNTTSLGMQGNKPVPIPRMDALPRRAIVTDLVYTPLETPLLLAARSLGLETVDGLGMLLHQAVPGFEKWFGIHPKVSKDLRHHVLNAGKPGITDKGPA